MNKKKLVKSYSYKGNQEVSLGTHIISCRLYISILYLIYINTSHQYFIEFTDPHTKTVVMIFSDIFHGRQLDALGSFFTFYEGNGVGYHNQTNLSMQ